MNKKSALLLAMFLFSSCGHWRTTTLKPKLIHFIQNGTKTGQVLIKSDEYALETLSSSIVYHNKKIIVADNELKRIQVLDSSGTPEMIIGQVKTAETKNVISTVFNFANIGVIHMDKDGNIFIQNRISKQSAGSASSYVLAFNPKGKLDYTLGQTGTPDSPFSHIESIETDEKGRLVIISRSSDSWNASGFTGKKRDYFFNLSKNDFIETEGKETYKGTIENVRPFYRGDSLLVSVVFYHGLRLKFRKAYLFSLTEGKIVKPLMTISDPRNEFFNLAEDKYVYFWNIENGETKFMICDIEGNTLNNIKLNDRDKKSYYSKIFSDRSGHIFSFQILKGGIKFFEWE